MAKVGDWLPQLDYWEMQYLVEAEEVIVMAEVVSLILLLSIAVTFPSPPMTEASPNATDTCNLSPQPPREHMCNRALVRSKTSRYEHEICLSSLVHGIERTEA